MTLRDADSVGADVTAVIVTYNSADTLPRLLASLDRSPSSIRAIVVDNGSADDTVVVARGFPTVKVIATGANLGYSGGINVGRRHLGAGEPLAILNPDLELDDAAIGHLLTALHGDPTIGIAVPQLRNPDGQRFDSLRREPTVLTSLADAIFGEKWRNRPRALAETLRRDDEYAASTDVAWAGGAALVVSAECNLAVGEWDEATYFLYSEETDYARRCRSAGFRVRYVPAAIAWHVGSGSGQSAELVALMSVNRIRYFERLHTPAITALFRATLVLQHALRLTDPRHRTALRFVLSRESWHLLPAGDGRRGRATTHE